MLFSLYKRLYNEVSRIKIIGIIYNILVQQVNDAITIDWILSNQENVK